MPALCSVVDRCGGCPWLVRSAEEERCFKISQTQRSLQRLGVNGVSLRFVDAPARAGYRNRIRLRVDQQGVVGFFNAEKSLGCAVLQPGLQEFVARLWQWARSHPGALAGIAHVEARASDADGRAGLLLTFRPDSNPPNDAAERDLLDVLATELGPLLLATDRTDCVPQQRFPHYLDSHLFVPLNGFIQINPYVNRLLVEHVVRAAIEQECRSFADLYGGAGNFALALATSGLSGALIERSESCIDAAAHSRRAQALSRLELGAGDAMNWARQRLSDGLAFDLVVVDPPRAGIREGLEIVSGLARRAIVYCSCNLVTLERDLRVLLGAGWKLRELVGFDMFPGTQHQETLAVCVR